MTALVTAATLVLAAACGPKGSRPPGASDDVNGASPASYTPMKPTSRRVLPEPTTLGEGRNQVVIGEIKIQEPQISVKSDSDAVFVKGTFTLNSRTNDFELSGKVGADGVAVLRPAADHEPFKVRGRATCLTERPDGTFTCDSAFVDIYVKHAEKIHTEQFLLENPDASPSKPEETIDDEPAPEGVDAVDGALEDWEKEEISTHENEDLDSGRYVGFPDKVAELFDDGAVPTIPQPDGDTKPELKKESKPKTEPESELKKEAAKPATEPSAQTSGSASKPSSSSASGKNSRPVPPASETSKPAPNPPTRGGKTAPSNQGATKIQPQPVKPQPAPSNPSQPSTQPAPAKPQAPTRPQAPPVTDSNSKSDQNKPKPAPQPQPKPAPQPQPKPAPQPQPKPKTPEIKKVEGNAPPTALPGSGANDGNDDNGSTKTSGTGSGTPEGPITSQEIEIVSPETQAKGTYPYSSDAKLVNAAALRLDSQFYSLLHPTRKTHYGTSLLVNYIERMASTVYNYLSGYRLMIGDLSKRTGGPLGRHDSHRNGLDADIKYLVKDPQPTFTSIVTKGKFTTDLHTGEMWRMFQWMAKTKVVNYIFVNHAVKKNFCQYARSIGEFDDETSRETLRRLWAIEGHTGHFHVRMKKCVSGNPRCKDQDPPPPGPGCSKA